MDAKSAQSRSLLLNSTGVLNAASVRRERMQGRDFLVAPITMIVPGILNGSKGPLFYPPEQVSHNIQAWNHVPLLAYHPHSGSGRAPEVLDKQGIGLVLHTSYNDKLQCEGWFDVEHTRRVDNRIITALETNARIEVSTGLYADKVPAPEGAIYNGQSYDWYVENFRPDHLAILPDQTGACSLNDGCGVLNSQGGARTLRVNVEASAPNEVKLILHKVSAAWQQKHPESDAHTRARGTRVAWAAVRKAGWLKNQEGKWVKSMTTASVQNTANLAVWNEEQSYEDWMDCLRHEFRNAHPFKYDPDDGHLVDYCYLISVFDGYVIYMQNGELYRQYYEEKEGTVAFNKAPEQVKRVIHYEPVKNSQGWPCACAGGIAWQPVSA